MKSLKVSLANATIVPLAKSIEELDGLGQKSMARPVIVRLLRALPLVDDVQAKVTAIAHTIDSVPHKAEERSAIQRRLETKWCHDVKNLAATPDIYFAALHAALDTHMLRRDATTLLERAATKLARDGKLVEANALFLDTAKRLHDAAPDEFTEDHLELIGMQYCGANKHAFNCNLITRPAVLEVLDAALSETYGLRSEGRIMGGMLVDTALRREDFSTAEIVARRVALALDTDEATGQWLRVIKTLERTGENESHLAQFYVNDAYATAPLGSKLADVAWSRIRTEGNGSSALRAHIPFSNDAALEKVPFN